MEDTSRVPWICIIIECVVPAFLTALDVETLNKLDSFMISFAMILQLGFYFYAKFGTYGYYKRNDNVKPVFTINGVITCIIVAFFPMMASICMVGGAIVDSWVAGVVFLGL